MSHRHNYADRYRGCRLAQFNYTGLYASGCQVSRPVYTLATLVELHPLKMRHIRLSWKAEGISEVPEPGACATVIGSSAPEHETRFSRSPPMMHDAVPYPLAWPTHQSINVYKQVPCFVRCSVPRKWEMARNEGHRHLLQAKGNENEPGRDAHDPTPEGRCAVIAGSMTSTIPGSSDPDMPREVKLDQSTCLGGTDAAPSTEGEPSGGGVGPVALRVERKSGSCTCATLAIEPDLTL